MRNVMKSHINKTVALMSVFAGVLSWFGCHYIYTTYSDKLSESVMIGSLCIDMCRIGRYVLHEDDGGF